jgi:predicted metalloprotease with PDZ domain
MAAFFRCCPLFLFFLLAQVLPGRAAQPTLTLQLRPTYARPGQASGLAVTYSLTPPSAKPRLLDLLFDTMTPYLVRGTDQVTSLVVTDGQGPVAFAQPIVRTKDGQATQHWQASRLVTGTVHVAYRVPVAQAIAPKRGPHLDLQAAGGGLAGAGVGFLLLPNLADSFTLHLSWQLPAGATAASSYGPGNQTVRTAADQLANAQFLAGPLYRYPAQLTSQGFSVYGLGKTAAEMDAPMAAAERVYDLQRQAFGGSATQPFKFFFRSYLGSPFSSGVASPGAFMLYLPPSVSVAEVKERATVAHEMVHAWGVNLKAPPLLDDWYSEGIADYFALTLPYAAGLYTPAEYLQLINTDASYYYTNARRLTPDRDVPASMWAGRNAWTLSYARGMLYFANLDAKLRQAGSSHSVLSFANELLRLQRAGHEPTAQDWVALLRREAGDWAVADWQAMVEGQLLRPVPGAFGAGVVSQAVKTGFFDLGFAEPLAMQAGKRIKGLVAGSPAALAGLREGDELTEAVDISPIYGSFHRPLAFTVRRGSALVPITYLPRSGQVEAWEWVAAPGAGSPPTKP